MKTEYREGSNPDFRVGNKVEIFNPAVNEHLKGKTAVIRSGPQLVDWDSSLTIAAYAVSLVDDLSGQVTDDVHLFVGPELRPLQGSATFTAGQRVGLSTSEGETSATILTRRSGLEDFYALKLDSGEIVIKAKSQINI